jgi:hypothetical protein
MMMVDTAAPALEPDVEVAVPPQETEIVHPKHASCFTRCISMCAPGSLSEPGSEAEAEWRDASDFYGFKVPQEQFERAPPADQIPIHLNLTGFEVINEQVERHVTKTATMAVFKYRMHRYPPRGILIPPPHLLTVTFAGVELNDEETFEDHDIEEDAVLSLLWSDEPENAPFQVHVFAAHYKPPKKKGKGVIKGVLRHSAEEMGRTGSRDNEGGMVVSVWKEETVGGVVNRVAGRTTTLPVFLTPPGQRSHAGMEPIGIGLQDLGSLGSHNAVVGQYIIVEPETVVEIPLSEGFCIYDCQALDPCCCKEDACDDFNYDSEALFIMIVYLALVAFIVAALFLPVYEAPSFYSYCPPSAGTTYIALTYIRTTCIATNGTAVGARSWLSSDVCEGYTSTKGAAGPDGCQEAKPLFQAAGLLAIISFFGMFQWAAYIAKAIACESRCNEWLDNHSVHVDLRAEEGCCCCLPDECTCGQDCCVCVLGATLLPFDLCCNCCNSCCTTDCWEECFGDECTVDEDCCSEFCNECLTDNCDNCCDCDDCLDCHCCDDDCFAMSSLGGILCHAAIGIVVTILMATGSGSMVHGDSSFMVTGGILWILSWALPVGLGCLIGMSDC